MSYKRQSPDQILERKKFVYILKVIILIQNISGNFVRMFAFMKSSGYRWVKSHYASFIGEKVCVHSRCQF